MTNNAYNYRVTDKPDSELVVIMPGLNLEEAKAELLNKYGDRLVSISSQIISETPAINNLTRPNNE
jgi:hypothetical protein